MSHSQDGLGLLLSSLPWRSDLEAQGFIITCKWQARWASQGQWHEERRHEVSIYKRGDMYWYKFMWKGQLVRESTKQGNDKVARQMEAAHRTSLAKGEVGIRERKPAPTLGMFAKSQFLPWAEATFAAKPKTWLWYRNGARRLLEFHQLAECNLDHIAGEHVAAYVARRQSEGLLVSSINRELQVLRRMLCLALEWGAVERVA